MCTVAEKRSISTGAREDIECSLWANNFAVPVMGFSLGQLLHMWNVLPEMPDVSKCRGGLGAQELALVEAVLGVPPHQLSAKEYAI